MRVTAGRTFYSCVPTVDVACRWLGPFHVCSAPPVSVLVSHKSFYGVLKWTYRSLKLYELRPSGAPGGVHLILNRSPFAPGAPLRAGGDVCRSRGQAGSRWARGAIAPVPKRENRSTNHNKYTVLCLIQHTDCYNFCISVFRMQ